MWCDPVCRRGGKLITTPRWRLAPLPDEDATRALAEQLELPRALAALLVQRGHGTPEAARSFLRPDLGSLADPMSMAGMLEAVSLITRVAADGGTVLVHGDYDVDGQCSTALLVRSLRSAGVKAHGFVPHRLNDGYDFGTAGLAEAKRIGASLIITCDCGITAVESVGAAREAGIAVVVTDHHLPGPELPPANAIIDPQLAACTAGLEQLSGTGVAFKLVQALSGPLGMPTHLAMHCLDLVALATVADVVPLVGENRTLVKHGLKLMSASAWPGVAALIKAAGIKGAVSAGQVGYTLGPRLNAAGRIDDAKLGLQLLLSDSPAEADALAARLEILNDQRQEIDQAILTTAMSMVEEQYADAEEHRAIVLAAEGWHPGVIGIVASRIVERFGRPTFLIGLDGDTGKGSGRSISALDLHSALTACGDLLERYGGHRMAAGLSIRADQVAAFRERFNNFVKQHLPLDQIGPEQRVDLVLPLAEVSHDLERLCRRLEPCGIGNPAPVFGTRSLGLSEQRTVGRNHLKAMLVSGDHRLSAIAFNWADRQEALGNGPVMAAFRLECNEWRDQITLQARVMSLAREVP